MGICCTDATSCSGEICIACKCIDSVYIYIAAVFDSEYKSASLYNIASVFDSTHLHSLVYLYKL